MSNQSRALRKQVLTSVKQEGRQAALLGKHKQTCPYFHTANMVPWMEAFDEALEELRDLDEVNNG